MIFFSLFTASMLVHRNEGMGFFLFLQKGEESKVLMRDGQPPSFFEGISSERNHELDHIRLAADASRSQTQIPVARAACPHHGDDVDVACIRCAAQTVVVVRRSE